MKIYQNNDEEDAIQKQCWPLIPAPNLFLAIFNGVVSVIVAHFFTPLWKRFTSWWKNEV